MSSTAPRARLLAFAAMLVFGGGAAACNHEGLLRAPDLDGDLQFDLVVAQQGGINDSRIYVYRGPLSWPVGEPTASYVETDSPAAHWPGTLINVGSLDEAFSQDFVAGVHDNGTGNVRLYRGDAQTPYLLRSGWQQDYGGHYGAALAAAHIAGSSYAELFVGGTAPQGEIAHVYVYRGQKGGFDQDATWTLDPPIIEGDNERPDTFGAPIAPAGDIDGDGVEDILITQVRAGRVFLFFGSEQGPVSPELLEGPGWGTSLGSGDYFGFALVGGLDLDGDQYGDFAISLPYERKPDPVKGAIWYYRGAPRDQLALTPVLRAEGPGQKLSKLGWAASNIGDFDGDGTPDVAATDAHWGTYVFSGAEIAAAIQDSRQPIPFWSRSDAADVTLPDTGPESGLFLRLSTLGDANSDGYDDFVIAHPFFSPTQQKSDATGRLYVVFGASEADDIAVHTIDKPEMDTPGRFGSVVLGIAPPHPLWEGALLRLLDTGGLTQDAIPTLHPDAPLPFEPRDGE